MSTSPDVLAAALPVLEATAFKCDPRQKNWTERYFLVQNSQLSYGPRKGADPKKTFDLSRLSPGFLLDGIPPLAGAKPPPHPDRTLVLLTPSGRALCVSFPDVSVYTQWRFAFQSMATLMEDTVDTSAVTLAVDGEGGGAAASAGADASAGAGAGDASATATEEAAAAALQLEEVPIKAHGKISKTNSRGKWQERWFELDGYQMTYRAREGVAKVKGTVDFSALEPGFLVEDYTPPLGQPKPPRDFTLALRLPGRVLALSFADAEDREYWLGWFRYVHARLHPPTKADLEAVAAAAAATGTGDAAAAAVAAASASASPPSSPMLAPMSPKSPSADRDAAATRIQMVARRRRVNARAAARRTAAERERAATSIQMAARRRAVNRRAAARVAAPAAAPVAASADAAASTPAVAAPAPATAPTAAPAAAPADAAEAAAESAPADATAAPADGATGGAAEGDTEKPPADGVGKSKGCCIVM